MELRTVMEQLRELGSEQKVKIYKRHGVNNDLFGVSIADLRKIKKTIKKDQNLAVELWETNNYDARMLATYIADPKEMSIALANDWVNSIDYYILSETLSSLIEKTSVWRELMEVWMSSDMEYVKSTAYYVFANALKSDKPITKEEIEDQLSIIKSSIHSESNRVKHTMNNALIAIGIFRPEFEKQAIEIAKSIGKVEVDHGKTSCKTPNAVDYIQRAITRNKARSKKK
ncbi:MAG: DNA alkylation repair protein [Candidatus Kariarchaeaceae archaeon]